MRQLSMVAFIVQCSAFKTSKCVCVFETSKCVAGNENGIQECEAVKKRIANCEDCKDFPDSPKDNFKIARKISDIFWSGESCVT